MHDPMQPRAVTHFQAFGTAVSGYCGASGTIAGVGVAVSLGGAGRNILDDRL